jgi:hypothetical protein
VHSDRRLTKLESHLMLDQPRDLRWVVYEQQGQQFELICSEITTNHQGSLYFASNELSCLLEAGKRYVLGVALVVGVGYQYYDTVPYSGALSFGNAVGKTNNSYASTMFFDVSEGLYRQRITTELP